MHQRGTNKKMDRNELQGIGQAIIKSSYNTSIPSILNHIADKTNENETFEINAATDTARQEQERLWQREDQIRKETQAREDTAYQRAVADMQRAGINPNLMNVEPAASGGGITSATGKDYTQYEKQIELLMQEIDNNFTASENEKDRIKDMIQALIYGTSAVAASAARTTKTNNNSKKK